MADEDLRAEIGKLKYHVRLLGESVDSRENPIASLVIEKDWSEQDLNDAHDIFEEAEALLDKGKTPDSGVFERKLEQRFGISYQGIKGIILAFYHSHQWTPVCEWYVGEQGAPPFEFSEIAQAIADRKRAEPRNS